MKAILRTSGGFVDLVLRLALAFVYFPHGAQKALGWFGGHGPAATIDFFSAKLGIPPALTVLVIAAEFLGPIGLAVGFLTRVAAFGIFCVMAGALWMVHYPVGFFMNWSGSLPAGQEGFEFHVLALALAFSVMVRGAGMLSIDGLLSRRR